MEPPSFKYLRPENFNKLDDKQLEQVENLTRFHIDSFDWMIDQGLQHAIKVTKRFTNRFMRLIFFKYFFSSSENTSHRVQNQKWFDHFL